MKIFTALHVHWHSLGSRLTRSWRRWFPKLPVYFVVMAGKDYLAMMQREAELKGQAHDA